MIRRIMGVETEYGITCTLDGRRRLSPDQIARYLFRPVVEVSRSSNVFLNNGGRLYLDVGSHPEYASAECDTIIDLLTQIRAGDSILNNMAVSAEKALAGEDVGGAVYLFKNNTDSAGNSYGCHENYLVARQDDFRKVSRGLLPFLASRQLICGAGKLHTDLQNGTSYRLSQRADHMWDGVSSATTRSRPMINTRDEPHADSKQFRRLHVIVGDSNMCDSTVLLKIASTMLVLEMLESNFSIPDLSLASTTDALHDISTDITGRHEVELESGETTCALSLQRIYYQHAVLWMKNRPQDANSESLTQAVDLWGRTLDAVESGDYSSVNREIDWIIKYELLSQYRRRYDWPFDHPKLAQIDLVYHDIRPGRGLFELMERKGLVNRLTTDHAVEEAVTTPPATTRAALRGRFIDAARRNSVDYTVDWTHLKMADGTARGMVINDPFAVDNADADALISDIEAKGSP